MTGYTYNKGQSSVEYLIVCAALVAALFTPLENDKSVINTCAESLKEWYSAFAYNKSMSTLPDYN
ncbi:class III signal peptide-containing protein [Shewanella sp. MF05960]|uniref:Class III signal peptide-containing protein n=1 Tax=Shewanella livingstonensis TaxID=150120 RepID=A0A3G8LRM3_9GAMM|nr:class III signal peptide-containing protein [Shewanella livingstonensis]AZG72094.1 class III signal peptide-containing protein [Shewanella livingstonensis]